MLAILGQNESCFKPACVYRINNSSRIECESSADRVEYLLKDAPTRSSLCHRVPRYQASPDTLNRNYEVRVTSPTPLHHSGGQVEAVVYHRDLDWGLICRWPLLSYSYWATARNVDMRSVGIVLSLFWGGKRRVSSTLSS